MLLGVFVLQAVLAPSVSAFGLLEGYLLGQAGNLFFGHKNDKRSEKLTKSTLLTHEAQREDNRRVADSVVQVNESVVRVNEGQANYWNALAENVRQTGTTTLAATPTPQQSTATPLSEVSEEVFQKWAWREGLKDWEQTTLEKVSEYSHLIFMPTFGELPKRITLYKGDQTIKSWQPPKRQKKESEEKYRERVVSDYLAKMAVEVNQADGLLVEAELANGTIKSEVIGLLVRQSAVTQQIPPKDEDHGDHVEQASPFDSLEPVSPTDLTRPTEPEPFASAPIVGVDEEPLEPFQVEIIESSGPIDPISPTEEAEEIELAPVEEEIEEEPVEESDIDEVEPSETESQGILFISTSFKTDRPDFIINVGDGEDWQVATDKIDTSVYHDVCFRPDFRRHPDRVEIVISGGRTIAWECPREAGGSESQYIEMISNDYRDRCQFRSDLLSPGCRIMATIVYENGECGQQVWGLEGDEG